MNYYIACQWPKRIACEEIHGWGCHQGKRAI